MPGAGDLTAEQFSAVLDSPETDFALFAPPSEPITDTKYAIGLHAAGLVRDDGTLQIGIGQVGDALAQGLIVRHRNNAQFHAIVNGWRPRAVRSLRTLPVLVHRFALGDECRHAFGSILKCKGRVKQVAFDIESLG